MAKPDQIWNRACNGGGPNPRPGDRALAALLRAHGLTMNGGMLHAVECLTPDQLSRAEAGYRFWGLPRVADLVARARTIFDAQNDLETHEALLDREYAALIPSDTSLVELLEEHLRSNPLDFAPL